MTNPNNGTGVAGAIQRAGDSARGADPLGVSARWIGPSYPETIAIRVHGDPVPQGSKTVTPARGPKGRPGLRDSNSKTLKPWRQQITTAAQDQCAYLDTLLVPCRVWVRFTFARPKAHYRTGRNSDQLRDQAPRFPLGGTNGGDIDKLVRAVLDALTDAKVWADDKQVVDLRARKMWAGEDDLALTRPGVDVIIEPFNLMPWETPL